MTRPGDPQERMRWGTSTRREAICKAAARLFRENGYPATGMREIAAAVGVEAASLYNHIRSKSELLGDICFRIAGRFSDHLDMVEGDAQATALDRLEAIVRFHIRTWLDMPDEVLVATNEFIHLGREPLQEFQQERRRYVRRFEKIIRSGIAEGCFRPLEPYVVVLTVMSAVRGIAFWHRNHKGISADALEEDMVRMIIGGLGIQPTP